MNTAALSTRTTGALEAIYDDEGDDVSLTGSGGAVANEGEVPTKDDDDSTATPNDEDDNDKKAEEDDDEVDEYEEEFLRDFFNQQQEGTYDSDAEKDSLFGDENDFERAKEEVEYERQETALVNEQIDDLILALRNIKDIDFLKQLEKKKLEKKALSQLMGSDMGSRSQSRSISMSRHSSRAGKSSQGSRLSLLSLAESVYSVKSRDLEQEEPMFDLLRQALITKPRRRSKMNTGEDAELSSLLNYIYGHRNLEIYISLTVAATISYQSYRTMNLRQRTLCM
jgi:hypothetical protein